MALNLDVVFTLATSVEMRYLFRLSGKYNLNTQFLFQILVYGIYTTLFFFTIIVMRKHRPYSSGRARGWMFLYSTILMFLLATVHIVLAIHRFLQAYITKPGPLIGVSYMFNTRSWDTILHISMFSVMTWIGDLLMIYRCYMVWNRNIWIAGLPAVILLVSVVINIYAVIWFVDNPNLTVKMLDSNRTVNLIYPVALIKNMLATGLIAWKIWSQHLISKTHGTMDWGSRLTLIGVLRIVVESAMIYTLQMLVLMILYFCHNNAQFIVQSTGIPSIGIIFALISLRVHYAKREWQDDAEPRIPQAPIWPSDREIESAIEFSPRNTPPTRFSALGAIC